jgi:hypothetical protein
MSMPVGRLARLYRTSDGQATWVGNKHWAPVHRLALLRNDQGWGIWSRAQAVLYSRDNH